MAAARLRDAYDRSLGRRAARRWCALRETDRFVAISVEGTASKEVYARAGPFGRCSYTRTLGGMPARRMAASHVD